MGKIANKFCDKIYLTDDNPRFENPKKIRLSIKKSINKTKLYEIANREKAKEKEEAKRIKLKEFERQKKEKEIAK